MEQVVCVLLRQKAWWRLYDLHTLPPAHPFVYSPPLVAPPAGWRAGRRSSGGRAASSSRRAACAASPTGRATRWAAWRGGWPWSCSTWPTTCRCVVVLCLGACGCLGARRPILLDVSALGWPWNSSTWPTMCRSMCVLCFECVCVLCLRVCVCFAWVQGGLVHWCVSQFRPVCF